LHLRGAREHLAPLRCFSGPESWIGPQRSAGGKAKREQDLYPNSGVENLKRRKALHCIRGAQREQGCSRHVLEILHLLSFPSRNAIAKLAQVHGLSKKGGPSSPRSCSRSTLWHHLREIRSPKPPFGGRKSGTPKNPKARKDRSRSPRRSKSPVDPEAWRRCEDSGRNSRFSEREALRPSQESRFHRGEHPQVSQNPGSFERGRETEEGFCHKKPTGESKTPSHEKTLKTLKVASPRILPPSIPQKSPPSWKGVSGIPAKDLILRWAYSSLHLRVFLEELRKVPLSRSNPKVLEGVDDLGNLRVLARIRYHALRPSPRVSISVEWWNGATGPSGKLSLSSKEVDYDPMNSPTSKGGKKQSIGKDHTGSWGRGALGGVKRLDFPSVPHDVDLYKPLTGTSSLL
jgi:hypothetical protein